MSELTRKYREGFEEAAEDFLRGYHYAQNSPLIRSMTLDELKYMASFYRNLKSAAFDGMAKACEDAVRRTVEHEIP